jgi:hypothetical protein
MVTWWLVSNERVERGKAREGVVYKKKRKILVVSDGLGPAHLLALLVVCVRPITSVGLVLSLLLVCDAM